MPNTDMRDDISAVLNSSSDCNDWPSSAQTLLETMGYRSERAPQTKSGNPQDLVESYPDTQSWQSFLDNTASFDILFQITGSEVNEETQQKLFETDYFDPTEMRSFLFAAVQLSGDSYPRGQYAAFTREVNKHLQPPTVVLFRTNSGSISLGFVPRRPNLKDDSRDVLGKRVSIIREIKPKTNEQHRAHLDILSELSLPERLHWMNANGKPLDFQGLLESWLAALDIDALNKRFYRELYSWFERTLNDKYVKFPTGQGEALRREQHIIRLITRLMFVWFIKEKGLVAEDLFIENQVQHLLKNYQRDKGDSYYRAILQNLFFATLNTEINARRFSKKIRDDHRNFSVYRYEKEIASPDNLLRHFSKTPFINGGLFDCLDSFDSTGSGGIRVDCFTDNARHRKDLFVPNNLFFGSIVNPGLVDLFSRYKFTVEENTPTEQEVALDPELL